MLNSPWLGPTSDLLVRYYSVQVEPNEPVRTFFFTRCRHDNYDSIDDLVINDSQRYVEENIN